MRNRKCTRILILLSTFLIKSVKILRIFSWNGTFRIRNIKGTCSIARSSVMSNKNGIISRSPASIRKFVSFDFIDDVMNLWNADVRTHNSSRPFFAVITYNENQALIMLQILEQKKLNYSSIFKKKKKKKKVKFNKTLVNLI
ncbi:hypothetical protein PUN28_016386 [Cardiocondyla obscurior]|uniref:Uncharacterized protein n=1 Tax=Cardiocondyla obscurior TaxID=286306 RepID=A0AAW2ER45_9HYME